MIIFMCLQLWTCHHCFYMPFSFIFVSKQNNRFIVVVGSSCSRKVFHCFEMAVSPEFMVDNLVHFRAPPPSPVASGRRSCVTNDDVLSQFLEHSHHVPDLILPDKIFPKQKFTAKPPTIDFRSLNSSDKDALSRVLDSTTKIGCFQLVNHGIPLEFISAISEAAARIFEVSPEKKLAVMRSPENLYGFAEDRGDEEKSDVSEAFVWGRDEDLKSAMEGIWPSGYSTFSEKMEVLSSHTKRMAERIVKVLKENLVKKSMEENESGRDEEEEEEVGAMCCIYKHNKKTDPDEWSDSLRYEVIRMLVRGSDYSHALCLHICNASSEFHVYSKKGWLSFTPDSDAVVVTAGDRIQAWSSGQYKHVMGKPLFRGRSRREGIISMAFLFSPCSPPHSKPHTGKTFSLGQQALVGLILTLFLNFLVFVFKKT